jgi:hypothetical protein
VLNVRTTALFLTITLSAFVSITVAGPNANAHVYLDYDFRTAAIEPCGNPVSTGDTCFVAVRIDGAVGLNSYSVKLQFDSNTVQFCDAAVKRSFTEKPFLESSGGQIIVLPHQRGNMAELAATIKGIGFYVSGNGCLAYFTFKCIQNGNPIIIIKEVKLVDGEGNIDKTR